MVSVELREGGGKTSLALLNDPDGKGRDGRTKCSFGRVEDEGEFIGHLVVQRNEIKRHSSFLLLPPPPPILHSCEVGLFFFSPSYFLASLLYSLPNAKFHAVTAQKPFPSIYVSKQRGRRRDPRLERGRGRRH